GEELNGDGECPANLSPSLLRYSRIRSSKASWSIKTDLRRCSDLCKRNVDSSGLPFPCSGFNLHSAPIPLCEFFPVEREDRPLEWSTREFVYYYSKTCLNVSLECRPSVFSFDVLPSLSLSSPILTSLPSPSANHCINICLQLNCPSARFDSTTSECLLLNETLRTGSFTKDTNVVHLENHCLPHPLVCPSGRIISTLLKNSDIAPFGFFAGVMSLRDCQRECIHSRLFLCRSFLFSSHSSECHLSPETSQLAVPSENLHLYEMVCIPSTVSSLVDQCNRPYSFERIPTMRSVSDAEITTHTGISSEGCISSCLLESKCLSFNYDVKERKCILLSTSRDSSHSPPSVTDENNDYFELSCSRLSPLHSLRDRPPPRVSRPRNESPSFDPSRAFLLLKGTSFSSSFHRHHHISSLSLCQSLCSQRENCSSFAFSLHRRECLLSSIPLRKQADLIQFTNPHPHFDLFVYPMIAGRDDTIPSFPTLLPKTTPSTTPSTTFSTTTTSTSTTTLPPSPVPPSTSPSPFIFASTPSLFDDAIFETHEDSTENPNLEEFTSTTSIPELRETERTEETTIETTEIPSTTTRSWEWEGGDSPPIRLPREEGVGVLQKGSVHVDADCLTHGVNITLTFNSTTPYTGAIYAIDRYSECGVYGRESRELSLFVPRPKHNTVCNAVEIGGQLAVLIVVSSDSIVPHSVTTSEDTFFHIKCQYPREGRKKMKGTVKGSSFRSSSLNQVKMREESTNTRVWLELMRDGKEVQSAAIGERLVARLKSALPAERIRVSSCVATRSGEEDEEDSPLAVPLISHGCPLIPHIMSAMRLHDGHWEADLSVFRMEGSKHIDIVCLVQLCPQEICPPMQNCQQERGRRETTEEEKGDSMRVRGRRVRPPPPSLILPLPLEWPLCLEFSTYFLLLLSFSSLLAAFFCSCVITKRRAATEIRRLTEELQGMSSMPRMTSLASL
ncbi:hypothetical protein PMAYCL1PPCAC_18512, partial [Pristionchus mayeri]